MEDRHMTSAPELGPVYLFYGCSHCAWRYVPPTVDEARQISWVAQVLYEKHECVKPGRYVSEVLSRAPLPEAQRRFYNGPARFALPYGIGTVKLLKYAKEYR